MDYTQHNAQVIDAWCAEGWEWGQPISHETYLRALQGDWGVYLTPTKVVPHAWFGELKGKQLLGLASGGGQQMPIFSALGAQCTLLDYSTRQCESERMVKSGEDALRQAGRNLLISFRESVTKELRAIVGDHVASVYSSEDLAKLVVSTVETWAKKPEVEDVAAILSSSDLAKLEEGVLAQLKAKMLQGVTLKANDNFDGGFRITVNEGTYYDYSAEAVTDMLAAYLSPRITALLKEAE